MCILQLDVMNATSLPSHRNLSELEHSDVTASNSVTSSNNNDNDDIQLLHPQPVAVVDTETRSVRRLRGPVFVIADADSSPATDTQRYTLDLLFHHSNYISASQVAIASKHSYVFLTLWSENWRTGYWKTFTHFCF